MGTFVIKSGNPQVGFHLDNIDGPYGIHQQNELEKNFALLLASLRTKKNPKTLVSPLLYIFFFLKKVLLSIFHIDQQNASLSY